MFREKWQKGWAQRGSMESALKRWVAGSVTKAQKNHVSLHMLSENNKISAKIKWFFYAEVSIRWDISLLLNQRVRKAPHYAGYDMAYFYNFFWSSAHHHRQVPEYWKPER